MKSRFWNKPAVNGRKMIFEALEERIVMDAAVDHALHGTSFGDHPTSFGSAEDPRTFYGISSAQVGEGWHHKVAAPASAGHDLVPAASMPLAHAKPAPTPASHAPADAAHAAPASTPAPHVATHVATHAASQVESLASLSAQKVDAASHSGLDVVLIQDSLEGKDAIAAAASPDAKVVFYSAEKDNLDSINAKLGELVSAAGQKIEHLAIAGHGEKDTLVIGSEQINLTNASEHRADFKDLAKNLASDAQVQFYNCSVAADALGEALVDRVAVMTGAQVFASSDTTGAKPGNWNLEYSSDPKAHLASVLDLAKLDKVPGHLAQAPATTLTPADSHIDAFRTDPDGRPILPIDGGGRAFFAANTGAGANGTTIYGTLNTLPAVAAGAAAGQNSAIVPQPATDIHVAGLTIANANLYYAAEVADPPGAQVFTTTPPGPMTAISQFNAIADPTIAPASPHISQITSNDTGTGIYFVGEQMPPVGGGAPPFPGEFGFEVWRHTPGGGAIPAGAVTNGTAGVNAGNVTAFNQAQGGIFASPPGTDYDPNIRELTQSFNGTMYLVGTSPLTADTLGIAQGREVWRTDGGPPLVLGDVTDNIGGAENGAVSCFGSQGSFGGVGPVPYPDYDPDISQLTPVAGTRSLYFVANEPHQALGYEIWRTDGAPPLTGGPNFQRTNNPVVNPFVPAENFGNITNFGLGTATDPQLHDLTFVGGAGGRLYFVGDNGAGPQIWGSNGANIGTTSGFVTDRGANAAVNTPLSPARPDISQLTSFTWTDGTGHLYFVGNRGPLNADDYEIFRVNPVVGQDTAVAVTNFPNVQIPLPAGYTPPTGMDPLDPMLQPIPAHANPNIQLIAGVNEGPTPYLYFAADSVNNQSRELYRVLAAAAPPDDLPATLHTMQQVTNFGMPDAQFEALRDATGGVVGFVATGAQGQEIYTLTNTAPTVTEAGGIAVGSAAGASFVTGLEDNNNHDTPISLPNAIRVGDPDTFDNLTVTVTPTAGFTAPGGVLVNAITMTAVGNAQVAPPAPDGSLTITVPAPIDPWTAQRDIDLTLASLQAISTINTHTNGFPVTPHALTVTVNDGVNPAVEVPVPITVTAVNDQPEFNPAGAPNAFPGIVPGVSAFVGPPPVPSGDHLVFDGVLAPPDVTTVHAPRITVGDVDAYEILGPGFLPPDGHITINVMAGAGTVTMPNRLVGGVPLSGQNLTFDDSIANINTALDGMIYRAPAGFVGPTNITITLDDVNPYLQLLPPTPHTGELESGAPLTLTAIPGLVVADPAYRPALGIIPINVSTPVGGFFGRLYDQP